MLTALEKRVGTTLAPMRFLPAQLSHLTARGLAFAQCTTSDAAARYDPSINPRPRRSHIPQLIGTTRTLTPGAARGTPVGLLPGKYYACCRSKLPRAWSVPALGSYRKMHGNAVRPEGAGCARRLWPRRRGSASSCTRRSRGRPPRLRPQPPPPPAATHGAQQQPSPEVRGRDTSPDVRVWFRLEAQQLRWAAVLWQGRVPAPQTETRGLRSTVAGSASPCVATLPRATPRTPAQQA